MTQKVKAPAKMSDLQIAAPEVMLGICTTCNNAPTCVNRMASSQPIWYCDQFDDYSPPMKSRTAPRHAISRPMATMETNGRGEGLCTTCANNDGCVNMVPGMTKLYCEEFC